MRKRWKLFALMAIFAFGVTLISWPRSANADLGTLTASVSSANVGQTATITGSLSNLSGASVTLVSSSGNWVSGTVSTGETVSGVGTTVLSFTSNGSTVSAVNFPEVSLPEHTGRCRLLHIHRNVPGVMAAVNERFSEAGINIDAQYLRTNEKVGYVVIDVDSTALSFEEQVDAIVERVRQIDAQSVGPE